MAPTAQANVQLVEPEPVPEPEKPRTGIRAVLFGPPGCGKGTQVRSALSLLTNLLGQTDQSMNLPKSFLGDELKACC